MATIGLPAAALSPLTGCSPRAASSAAAAASSATRVTPSDVLSFWFEGDATQFR